MFSRFLSCTQCWLLAVSLTLAPTVLWGQTAAEKSAAQESFKKGQIQYNLGRFEKALELFSKAYEIMPHGAFLYNIGQCHRQLENHEKAIFFFEGYLRNLPNAPNRDAVEDLISEHRAKVALAKARVKATPEPPAQPPAASAPQPAPVPPAVAAPAAVPPPPPPAKPKNLPKPKPAAPAKAKAPPKPKPATETITIEPKAPEAPPEITATHPQDSWMVWVFVGGVAVLGTAAAVAILNAQSGGSDANEGGSDSDVEDTSNPSLGTVDIQN